MKEIIENFIGLMVAIIMIRQILSMYEISLSNKNIKTISGYAKSKGIIKLIEQLVEKESNLKVINDGKVSGGVICSLFDYNLEMQESLYLMVADKGKTIGQIKLLISKSGDITIGMLYVNDEDGNTNTKLGNKLYTLILDLIMREIPEHEMGIIERGFYDRGVNLK